MGQVRYRQLKKLTKPARPVTRVALTDQDLKEDNKMRSLILFDGSRNSQLSLLNACQDAYDRAARLAPDEQPETNEVLVLVFEDMAAASELPEGRNELFSLLEKAVQRLECCGDFFNIRGEIVQCREAEVTNVLTARAKEWKAESIYFPVAFDPDQAERPRRQWFGFGRKIEVQEVAQPQNIPAFTSEIFDMSQILENSECRIVLTNQHGIATRLYCVKPAARRVTFLATHTALPARSKHETVLR